MKVFGDTEQKILENVTKYNLEMKNELLELKLRLNTLEQKKLLRIKHKESKGLKL